MASMTVGRIFTVQARQTIQLRFNGGQLIAQCERKESFCGAALPVVRATLAPAAQQSIFVTRFGTQILQTLAKMGDTQGMERRGIQSKLANDFRETPLILTQAIPIHVLQDSNSWPSGRGELFRPAIALRTGQCVNGHIVFSACWLVECLKRPMEGMMPTYRLFYTDKPLPAGTEPDFAFALPLNFVTKDEALSSAFKLIFSGAIVWKIEGPNGFYLDRESVEREYLIFKST